MPNGIVQVPAPVNEPVMSFGPGSAEKASLKERLAAMLAEDVEIPLVIGGREVRTGKTAQAICPHDHQQVLATYHQAGAAEVEMAVMAAADAWRSWSEMAWQDRAAIFLKAAAVIDGVLVGLSHLNGGQYFGLDLDTGRVLWTSGPRQAGNAAIVRSGHTIFSLQDDAELVIVHHSRTEFAPRKRYEVATSATWAQPTVSGSRLFIKDVSRLTLWTLGASLQ